MSVENHRHCQATVLGATGASPGTGLTWETIRDLPAPNLDYGWQSNFVYNTNITDDLADIIELIDKAFGKIRRLEDQIEDLEPETPEMEAQKPLPGDLISVTGTEQRTVNVKNSIGDGYSGVVGIVGSGTDRRLSECSVRIENEDNEGDVIATLYVGNQPFPIRVKTAADQPDQPDQPEEQPRYVITEDKVWDIVLSGGDNDGVFLDYTDED